MNDMMSGINWLLNAESNKLDELIVEINDFRRSSDGKIGNIGHFEFGDGQHELARMSPVPKNKLDLDSISELKLLHAVKSLFFNGHNLFIQHYSKGRTCCLFSSP
jgi:hypothetical protein